MNPARILIVEDEAILAAHLALSLGQMGYRAAGQAATGEAAVELALKEKPDAILMDIRLRGEMTGLQAAEAIRRSSDVPIIYLTAYAEENVLQQAKITDAFAFLAKPVREQELRACLEMALYKHEADTRRRRAEEALQESELKFRNVFHNSRDAIVVNRDGVHVIANQAYIKLYGYESAEELEGRSVLDLVAPSHRAQIAEYVGLRNAGQPAPGFFESRGLRKDGTEFDTEIQASTFDLHGRIHTLAVIRDVSERKKAEERLRQSYRELRVTFQAAIKALSSAFEMRDPYTAGHQERVTRLAVAIAQEMGLDEDRVEGIRIAGTVHDIGKMSIPAEILTKPTKLSPAEWALIQTHPRTGFTILENIRFPWPIARIVLQHHERMDGTGYPDKLIGETILLEARIIAVADVLEAMSSHRPYRPALGPREGIEEIRKGKGTWYDPAVVDACVRVIEERGFTLA